MVFILRKGPNPPPGHLPVLPHGCTPASCQGSRNLQCLHLHGRGRLADRVWGHAIPQAVCSLLSLYFAVWEPHIKNRI